MAYKTSTKVKKNSVVSDLINEIKLRVNTREKLDFTNFISYKKIYRDRDNVVELNNELGFVAFLNSQEEISTSSIQMELVGLQKLSHNIIDSLMYILMIGT
jgi:hypothetical protein